MVWGEGGGWLGGGTVGVVSVGRCGTLVGFVRSGLGSL